MAKKPTSGSKVSTRSQKVPHTYRFNRLGGDRYIHIKTACDDLVKGDFSRMNATYKLKNVAVTDDFTDNPYNIK